MCFLLTKKNAKSSAKHFKYPGDFHYTNANITGQQCLGKTKQNTLQLFNLVFKQFTSLGPLADAKIKVQPG